MEADNSPEIIILEGVFCKECGGKGVVGGNFLHKISCPVVKGLIPPPAQVFII